MNDYFIAWIITTLLFFITSVVLKKNKSIVSTLKFISIFSIYYIIAYFAFKQYNMFTMIPINSITIGILTAILWFLFKFFIQKISFNKSIISTSYYILFYSISEIIINLLK